MACLKGPLATAPSLDQWRAAVVTVQQAGQAALRLLQNPPQDTGMLDANQTPLLMGLTLLCQTRMAISAVFRRRRVTIDESLKSGPTCCNVI